MARISRSWQPRVTYGHLGLSLAVGTTLVVIAWQTQRTLGTSLLPHSFCLSTSRALLLLHLVSDSLIALAYLLIPWSLLRVLRLRRDLPFGWIAWVFGAFIVACGSTHLLDVATLYLPIYWYSGVAKGFTAAVSLLTAALLYRITPAIVATPTIAQMERTNQLLREEIARREAAETELRAAQKQLDGMLRSAEARADESAAFLDQFFEAAPLGLAILDSEGGVLRRNAQFDRIPLPAEPAGPTPVEQPPASSLGRYLILGAGRAPGETPVEAPETASEGATERRVERWSPQGEATAWRGVVFPLRGARGGEIYGAALRDISKEIRLEEERQDALRRAEQALQVARHERAQFQALADNIAQLAWMADPSGAIHWYNERWYEFTGASPADMEGWGWRSVHHPDHLERVERRFKEHLESGAPWEDTFPLRRHDGVWRWFLSRAFPLVDASGQIVRWFGTNTDITEQRDAQEELREDDRRKGDFITILAHELRNPLAPVLSSVEALRKVGSPDARGLRLLDIVERQVLHMSRLINDLLDIARISRNVLGLKPEQVDLVHLARTSVETFRPLLAEARIDLGFHCELDELWITADGTRIAQAVGNMLHNAMRFAEGTWVRVSVSRDASTAEAVVRIEDGGRGIPAEMLPRLFKSFNQADQDPARSKGGLGLGLVLSRRLLELHAGRVTVASDGDRQGATFEIRLPMSPRAKDPVRAPSPPPRSTPSGFGPT